MRVSRKTLTTIGLAALAIPLLAAAGSAVMFDCGPVRPAPQEDAGQAEVRFDGEYGLWVRESGDSLVVQWLTREAGAGYLEVLVDGGAVFKFETEPDTAHAVSFPRPAAPELMLRYGGRSDPQDAHETVIYFDLQRRPIQTEFEDVDTLFVVGDVHGKYDELSELFRNAGLIDEDDRWTGGRKWIVLLGDLLDRGPDVHKILWFLYELERDAARHGGRVQVLLGNHEIMAMTDDPRYVSPKELLVAQRHGVAYWQLFDPRSSILGKWLAAKPALIRVDRVLLAHGGVGPEYMDYTIPEFDDSLATFMSEQWFSRMADSTAPYTPLDSVTLFRRFDFFFDDNSVFWYRSYVYTDTLGHVLQQVLERHDSDIHVVAHTPVDRIQQMYDGDLIAVDLEDAATEMLLLIHSTASYERFRYTLSGPPQPLEIAVPTGGG